MTILFVNFTAFWGGGEGWIYRMMEEFRQRAYKVVLLTNYRSALFDKAHQNGYPTHTIQVNKLSFLNPFKQAMVKKKLLEIAPDAIFLNSTMELKTIGLQIGATTCKKVFFLRGIPQPIKIGTLKRHLFSKVVSHVIVNSEYVKKSIGNLTHLLPNEPQVIYHGIDTQGSKLGNHYAKRIAVVGRLSYEKGIDMALKIFQKVLTQHPESTLWIMGDGKEKDNLIQLSNELGVQESVKWCGFVQNVEDLLSQCSILLVPSRWEGFGLVLLEAMKLHIPCLAFDHTATNEIIIDQETGFLVPYPDIELMAEKISYLLSHPEIAKKMGDKGNEILEEKFSIEKSIRQYEQLIMGN